MSNQLINETTVEAGIKRTRLRATISAQLKSAGCDHDAAFQNPPGLGDAGALRYAEQLLLYPAACRPLGTCSDPYSRRQLKKNIVGEASADLLIPSAPVFILSVEYPFTI